MDEGRSQADADDDVVSTNRYYLPESEFLGTPIPEEASEGRRGSEALPTSECLPPPPTSE